MAKKGRKKGTPKKGGRVKKVQDQDVEFVCTLEARVKNVQDQEPVDEEQDEAVEEQEEPVEDVVEQEQASDVPQQQTEEQHNSEEPEGEVELSTNEEITAGSNRKRKRGPTKMKDLAKDPSTRVHVDFNIMGEAYGSGSVKLSSYLGPLVREHVPVTLEGWKNISEEVKTVLWKSVQVISYIQRAQLDIYASGERCNYMFSM